MVSTMVKRCRHAPMMLLFKVAVAWPIYFDLWSCQTENLTRRTAHDALWPIASLQLTTLGANRRNCGLFFKIFWRLLWQVCTAHPHLRSTAGPRNFAGIWCSPRYKGDLTH
ncbi:hypothetical protein J3E68DRAFT_392517 [Trichoderma sp. SZMC 28012]